MTKNIYNSWYETTHTLSYNALLNFIDSNRNIGKTWALKIRAFKRFIKRGRKTCWVRTFEEDIKATKEKFFDSALLNKLGIKADDLEIKGRYLYYKPRKEWFVEFVALSKQHKYKSVDDVKLDTIVYDEYRDTVERMKYYRGNIVNDFFNLRKSKERCHKVICFFLGNQEAIYNPFQTYFNIEALPKNFCGVKLYKNNTILVEQIPKLPKIYTDSEVFKKDKLLFENTAFDNYLTNGATLVNVNAVAIKPVNASNLRFIAFFDIGYKFVLGVKETEIYAYNTFDRSHLIFTDKANNDYKKAYIIKGFETRFISIKQAYKYNKLFATDEYTQEAITKLLTMFNLI